MLETPIMMPDDKSRFRDSVTIPEYWPLIHQVFTVLSYFSGTEYQNQPDRRTWSAESISGNIIRMQIEGDCCLVLSLTFLKLLKLFNQWIFGSQIFTLQYVLLSPLTIDMQILTTLNLGFLSMIYFEIFILTFG